MADERVTNALTIDFEDWYQGIEIPYERWGEFEDRIEFVGGPETGDFIALQCVNEQVEAVIARGYSDAMAALSQRMKQPLTLQQALMLIG